MKNWRHLNRFQASALHLIGSVLIAVVVFLLFQFVWYPDGLFHVAAAGKLLLLVAGVDVVIGPLLTLAVFNPNKRLLPFDLTVIAILQVAALSYGVTIMLQSRPVFLVGVIDRFELVMANEIEPDDLAAAKDTPYGRLSWSGPVLVGARPPESREQRNKLLFQSLAGGADIDRQPALYTDYAQASAGLVERARPLADWVGHSHPGVMAARDWVLRHDRRLDQVLVLPLKARMAFAAILLDQASGQPLRSFEFDPYEVLPQTTRKKSGPDPEPEDDAGSQVSQQAEASDPPGSADDHPDQGDAAAR